MPSHYLRAKDAAEYLKVSHRTLEGHRLSGTGPRFFRPPGSNIVLYDVEDLDRWVRAGLKRSTSDTSAAVEETKTITSRMSAGRAAVTSGPLDTQEAAPQEHGVTSPRAPAGR